MDNESVLFPEDIYVTYLSVIDNVRFTPREIDIIACLLHGKSTKGIAKFLSNAEKSLGEKSIETHILNIRRKIGGAARESVINFIERSNKYKIIHSYYAALLIQKEFRKSLEEISAFIKSDIDSFHIVAFSEKNTLNASLFKHLQLSLQCITSKVTIEVQEYFRPNSISLLTGIEKQGRIYILPQKELILSQIIKANQLRDLPSTVIQEPKSSNIIFLLQSKEEEDIYTTGLSSLDIKFINLVDQKNYYLLFFAIIEKLFPHPNLDKIKDSLKNKYEGMQVAYPPSHSLSAFNSDQPEEKWKRRIEDLLPIPLYALYIIIMLLIGGGALAFYYNVQKQETYFRSLVRPNLSIPIESVFLPRPYIINDIKEKFRKGAGIQVIALIGPGGSGKTTVARQYAREEKADIIWEINITDKVSLYTSFKNLADILSKTKQEQEQIQELDEIKTIKEKEEKLILLVQDRLRAARNWLLIYDDVQNFLSIQKYFPYAENVWGKGKVIITTRDSNIQENSYINNTIRIKELEQGEKVSLFSKIMGDKKAPILTAVQNDEEKDFLNHLPPFPLDVTIAAHYLKATNISYAKYLEYLNTHREDFVNVQETILKEVNEYTQTRFNIITLSLQQLISTHKDFGDLLLFISLIDSQNIPKSLLYTYKEDTIVDNFIYNLKKYSLITDTLSTNPKVINTISMHHSTQKISLVYLIKKFNLAKDKRVLQLIADTIEQYVFDAIEQDDSLQVKSLLTHCEKFLSNDNLLTDTIKYPVDSVLGSIYYHSGYYIKAKQILEENLLNLNKYYNKNNAIIAWTLTYLGAVYIQFGEFEKAKDLLEKSIFIYQQYPDQHAAVVRALVHLGTVYRGLGDGIKAKELLEGGIKIYKKHYSENHYGIGWVLVHSASIYRELGDYAKAKDLLEQGIKIYKEHYSENHLGVGRVSIELGNIYREFGDYLKAKELLEEGAKIYKQHCEENYIEYAWTLTTLGNIYRELGDCVGAKDLLEEGIATYKKHQGEDHPDYPRSLMYLGMVYAKLGDFVKAKETSEEGWAGLEKYFSKDHYRRPGGLLRLGVIYKDLGNYKKAKEILEQSLRLYRKLYAESDTIDIAWALAQLGNVYRSCGNYERAKILLEESEAIYKKLLGNNNARIGWISILLGCVYKDLGDYGQAKIMLEKGYRIYSEYFDEDNVKIAKIKWYLGEVYKSLGEYKKAKGLLEEGLIIYEKNYGTNHSYIAKILNILGEIYLLESNTTISEELVKKSLNIFKQIDHPESYRSLEILADLHMKYAKQAWDKKRDQQAQNSKIQALDYLKQALAIATPNLLQDSPHVTRLKFKLKNFEEFFSEVNTPSVTERVESEK